MENRDELIKYELEKACEALKEAQILYEAKFYSGAANRSYYAAFHSMSAMLAYDGYRFKSHAGVISKFREYYIKEGVIDKSFSPKITAMFNLRTNCDYKQFYVVAKSDVEKQISNAKDLIGAIERVLEQKLAQNQNLQQEQPLRNDLIEQQKQCGYYTPPATPIKQEQPAPEQTPKLTQPKRKRGFGGRHM